MTARRADREFLKDLEEAVRAETRDLDPLDPNVVVVREQILASPRLHATLLRVGLKLAPSQEERGLETSATASPAGHDEFNLADTELRPATTPLGGGYYFVPPVPNGEFARLGDQFF